MHVVMTLLVTCLAYGCEIVGMIAAPKGTREEVVDLRSPSLAHVTLVLVPNEDVRVKPRVPWRPLKRLRHAYLRSPKTIRARTIAIRISKIQWNASASISHPLFEHSGQLRAKTAGLTGEPFSTFAKTKPISQQDLQRASFLSLLRSCSTS
jgi:hypothetical protein